MEDDGSNRNGDSDYDDCKPSASPSLSKNEQCVKVEQNNTRKRSLKPLNLYKRFIPRSRDQSRSNYLLVNERYGQRLISNYEKRRKVAAETEGIPYEESGSSSDENDEKPVQPGLKDTVDWYNVANSYGNDFALLDSLPVWEISSLVGWATHLTRDNEPPRVPEDDEATLSTRVADERESLFKFNPLRGLVNTPLPPSHLEYISNIATNEVLDFEEVLELLAMFDQSSLIAMGMLLEEMLTTSLLPLAQAHVQACREMESRLNPDSKDTAKKPGETWNPETTIPDEAGSAAPPAKNMGPQRGMDQQLAAKVAAEDFFHRLTLPPEEAILKLVQERQLDTTMGLPFLYPPTRTLCENRTAVAPHVTAMRWCAQHGLDIDFVQSNMDLFSAFLPIAPKFPSDDYEHEDDEPQNEGLI